MSHKPTITNGITEAAPYPPGCLVEEPTRDCPSLTWNQIFMEAVDLSEEGRVILEGIRSGIYITRLPVNI
jgi:hypothetical protein